MTALPFALVAGEAVRHTGGAAHIGQARELGIRPDGVFTPFEQNMHDLGAGAGGTVAVAGRPGRKAMIELKEPRPPASPEALAATERRLAELGHRVPPSYRAFLAEQDGGRPVRNVFTFEQNDREHSSRVAAFLGVEPAPDGDLAGVAGRVGDIPPGILPIAGDEFGNYVCLDTREDRDGPVLFWDHEEGFDDDLVDFSNLHEIAPDLQHFLDGLTEQRPRRLQPQVEPTAQAWRRLFSSRRA